METKKLDELKGNLKNPRSINKHDFEALVRSIKEFGDLSGIVFNVKTMRLVGGHQRTEAFKQMSGEKKIIINQRFPEPNHQGTVAIGYVDYNNEQYSYREVDWDEGREAAANIAANRIQGQFDLDLLAQVTYEIVQLENGQDLAKLTGQTQDEIDRLLDMVGVSSGTPAEEDEAPPLDTAKPAISKLGEVYALGKHRLMCGDATSLDDVQLLMNGEQANFIWTDPPYNVAYEGKTKDALTIQNDKFKDGEAFYDFLYLAFSNLNAVTRAGASIYVCHPAWEMISFTKAMTSAGFHFKQQIIWNKSVMALGRQDYQWKHEPILYGWKEGGRHYFVPNRDLTTVWDFDKPSKSEDHPTMKPVALVRFAINNSSKRGDNVLDTFAGSGSTLIAADMLERQCYSMELDPRYCDVIRKRYAKHIDQEGDWQGATPALAPPSEAKDEAPIAPIPS